MGDTEVINILLSPPLSPSKKAWCQSHFAIHNAEAFSLLISRQPRGNHHQIMIVLLDNVNRATRQCHNQQWTMPNIHTMQIVQHIWHWIAAYLALYGCTIGIMCLYNMFGHSWDDRSGLVTRETLYLVWSLGWRLVWFGHLGDAWSGLVTRVTLGLVWSLGWCQRLRDDNCQNIVWFQLLRRRCLIWPTQETRCPGDITQET